MTQALAFIIEDDLQLGQIFSLALSRNFEIELIPDGNMAMKRLAENIPDLVVLDYNLPGITGGEILQQIRADARMVNTKVIVATADTNQYSILHEQADLAMLKPVSPMQLSELALRLHPTKR
jgi:DNA-binding response OmpR family regulator